MAYNYLVMKTLQIESQTARRLYSTAAPELKSILVETFGKEFFDANIFERVKSYEDACSELGEQPLNEAELKSLSFTDDEIAYRKLKTITRALNEDPRPDMFDAKIKKWYPYFRGYSSGFAFYDSRCCYSSAGARYASRLCFKSSELAAYAGRQFTDLYRRFIL
jgi:hypothetical protein